VVLMVRDGRMRDRQVRSALHELGTLNNILMAIGLVDIVPNPELEVLGRRNARRSPAATKDTAPPEPAEEEAMAPEPAVEEAMAPEPEVTEAPEPASEVESSANGHHDRVEDSPYEQSYDGSLPQS